MRVPVGITGTIPFVRSIGGAIGVAIFGAIANSVFDEGDAALFSSSTSRAPSAAVLLAVLVVAVATVARVVD